MQCRQKFAPSQYWYMEETSADLQKLTDTHTRVVPCSAGAGAADNIDS